MSRIGILLLVRLNSIGRCLVEDIQTDLVVAKGT